MDTFNEKLNQIDDLLSKLKKKKRYFDHQFLTTIRLSSYPIIISSWARKTIELITWDLYCSLIDNDAKPWRNTKNQQFYRQELITNEIIDSDFNNILKNTTDSCNPNLHPRQSGKIDPDDYAISIAVNVIIILKEYNKYISSETYPKESINLLSFETITKEPITWKSDRQKHETAAEKCIDNDDFREAIFNIDQALKYKYNNVELLARKEYCEKKLNEPEKSNNYIGKLFWFTIAVVITLVVYYSFVDYGILTKANGFLNRIAHTEQSDTVESVPNSHMASTRLANNLSIADKFFEVRNLDSSYYYYQRVIVIDSSNGRALNQINILQGLFRYNKLMEDASFQLKRNDIAGSMASLLEANKLQPDSLQPKLLIAKLDSLYSITIID